MNEQEKREKVIKGLECCQLDVNKCLDCPYLDKQNKVAECGIELHRDALALLKAQEPRVMTLEEVLENAGKIGFPCWVEDHIEDVGVPFLFPAVVTSDDTYVQYTGNDYYEGAIYHWAYNKRLRCWTSRPTDEQRETIPWE